MTKTTTPKFYTWEQRLKNLEDELKPFRDAVDNASTLGRNSAVHNYNNQLPRVNEVRVRHGLEELPMLEKTTFKDSDVSDNEWLHDTFFNADWSDEYYGEDDEDEDEEE